MQRNFDMSAATTLPMPPVVAASAAPKRLPVDPLVCYAADGFVLGLKELANSTRVSVENFAERLEAVMPERLNVLLRNPDYQLPEALWRLIQELNKEEHTRLIYRVIWHAQMCEALYLVIECTPKGIDPLETFQGREAFVLPLELTGLARLFDLLERIRPLLPQFGLDKWKMYNLRGEIEYPDVVDFFYSQRAAFFRLCRLETHVGMERFLRNPSEAMAKVPSLPCWPEALSIFHGGDEVIQNAINNIALNW